MKNFYNSTTKKDKHLILKWTKDLISLFKVKEKTKVSKKSLVISKVQKAPQDIIIQLPELLYFLKFMHKHKLTQKYANTVLIKV